LPRGILRHTTIEEPIAQCLDGLAHLAPQVLAHLDAGGDRVFVELFEGQETPLGPPWRGEGDEAAGVAEAVEGAKVALVARLKDRFEVELDIALAKGVVIVAQQAQQDAIGEQRPPVGAAGVEECLEHVVGGFGFDAAPGVRPSSSWEGMTVCRMGAPSPSPSTLPRAGHPRWESE